MKKVVQKFTDIALVGQSDSIDAVKKVLSFQSKKTFRHYHATDVRFIDSNILVVDGEKVSANKFLIASHATKKYSAPSDVPKTGTELYVIGNDVNAINSCVQRNAQGAKVSLLCESPLLADYDASVQDIVERYLKKSGVSVVKGITILSLEHSDTHTHITGSIDSSPWRASADELFISPDQNAPLDIGIPVTDLAIDAHPKTDGITKLSNNVVSVQDGDSLSLADIYKLSEFLCGKKSVQLQHTRRHIYSSDDLSFMSIGMLEQDYFDTHFSYKKCLVKIHSADKSPVQWFLKVLTSTHNKILGIHAVLPFRYANTDLLVQLVERGVHVSELGSITMANDKLADAYIDVIGELTMA